MTKQHVYLTGMMTGALMGIFASFFSFLLISATIGDIRTLTSGATILNLMIFATIFCGIVIGSLVSLFVIKFSELK